MRQRLPWLLAIPVMAAGSFAAHSLTYFVVSARVGESGAEGPERTSSNAPGYVVLLLGVLAATALVGGAARLLSRRRRQSGTVSRWVFFVLPPVAFALQELGERLLRAEAFPFNAALEPRFLLGLLLQLPFGLLALLFARALLRVVKRLQRALCHLRGHRLPALASWAPRLAFAPSRIALLALGYPERGPPAR